MADILSISLLSIFRASNITAACLPVLNTEPYCLSAVPQVDQNLVFPESGISLEVLMGRPDIEHAVQQALDDAQQVNAKEDAADSLRAAVVCAGKRWMGGAT